MKGVGFLANTASIETIINNLEQLSKHVKTYNTGSYPAFFLQLHTPLHIQDILEMKLSDFYYWEDGMIKMLPEIFYGDESINLDAEGRKEFAWYALQRIPVRETTAEVLDDWLCVNKQGRQLQIQGYRKMLERASGELNFKNNYNVGYLHSLYGYLEIALGKKTVAEVAAEYRVSRYYLLNRIFRGMEIQYVDSVIQQVANIKEE